MIPWRPIINPFEKITDEDSFWFLGMDKTPSLERITEIFSQYDDQDIFVQDGFVTRIILLKYDVHGVAWVHLWMAKEDRIFGQAVDAIQRALSLARRAGMRKVIAPLMLGNPFLNPGRKRKLGFELEGILKRHAVIGKKEIDVFLYSKFLV